MSFHIDIIIIINIIVTKTENNNKPDGNYKYMSGNIHALLYEYIGIDRLQSGAFTACTSHIA